MTTTQAVEYTRPEDTPVFKALIHLMVMEALGRGTKHDLDILTKLLGEASRQIYDLSSSS